VSVFVDTSGLLAVMVATDEHHGAALGVWEDLMSSEEPLVATNYVALELFAILQRRFGVQAVQLLATTFLPVLELQWVDLARHNAAVAALLAANRRGLSLVDCTSFVVMRELAVTRAFSFDPHFAEQGFEVVPPIAGTPA